ncbi:MAG TPA: NAD-dependent epimerase/dehydratase family protein [Roseococcus sp.]|jgi:UDP-glucose 4-epimerase|nr:NAD-dependent epimerase/dehydratase family protein [Roseococcus sp.]
MGVQTLLLTGASGFIGGAILRRLRARADVAVRAASRQAPPGGTRLELNDPATLPPALAGVDAVIHCAVGNAATTIAGTRHLLAAARAAGVRRFVHLSSVSVYAATEGALAEDSPRVTSEGAGYAHWKAAAERECEAAGIEAVLLRPAIVHGAGSVLWVGKMGARLRNGLVGEMGAAGEGWCNPVHVDDVAAAAEAALTGRPGAYNISGAAPLTWNAYFAGLAAAMGIEPPRLTPARVARQAWLSLPLKALARAAPALRPRLPALVEAPARGELALFRQRVTYPIQAAAEGLGWRPSISVEQGWAEGAAWLRAA